MARPPHSITATGHRHRPLTLARVAVAMALTAVGMAVDASPGVADHDGLAEFGGGRGRAFSPSSVLTAGGAHRIYGKNFHGVTRVTYVAEDPLTGAARSADSPNFAVVDSGLILAQAPPAEALGVGSNTLVDVVLIDGETTVTRADDFLYTDATITAAPSTGLHDGDTVTVSVRNYGPNEHGLIMEWSPLADYAEPRPFDPNFWTEGPFADPYGDDLVFRMPDLLGSFDQDVNVKAEPNFNTDGDPSAQCPPTQAQANLGLANCLISYSDQFRGPISTPIAFEGNPAPEPAVVALAATTANVGATVSIDGVGSVNWGGSALFGSSTSPTRPGETAVTIELCDAAGTSCLPAAASAWVSLVRYKGPEPEFHDGRLLGATLGGSFTVPHGGCTGECRVRVRQQRYGEAPGAVVEASAPLTVVAASAKAVADFDGDGLTDISVFRPSTGAWYIRSPASTTFFGRSGDAPVPTHYDADTDADIAVFRPSSGGWYVKDQGTTFFGVQGDIPVPADYSGDGQADIAVFRPSNGGWYLRNPATTTFFGRSGDIPVPADYAGDHRPEIAVFRPATGAWYIAGQPTAYFGISGDIPVPGDYDGNGKAELAVFRPSTGAWHIAGRPRVYFGRSGDVPVPGDYDTVAGDDVAVFRPANGGWYRPGQPTAYFGLHGDIPLPLPYAIYQAFFSNP